MPANDSIWRIGQSVFGHQTKIIEKPWGREIWWALTDHYCGKILEVHKGHRLSLQYHERKIETILFLSGKGKIQIGKEEFLVKPGFVAHLEPSTIHRIIAITDLVMVEVSTPDVEDVVRLEDSYGRT